MLNFGLILMVFNSFKIELKEKEIGTLSVKELKESGELKKMYDAMIDINGNWYINFK